MIQFSSTPSGATRMVLTLMVSAVSLCGCSDGRLERQAIAGSVTLDGQPLSEATIIFTPKGEGLAAAASIVAGSFALTDESGPTPGEFTVRINPLEAEIDERPGNSDQLPRANRRPRIPRAYQQDGKLTATITSHPDQSLTFELSTRPK